MAKNVVKQIRKATRRRFSAEEKIEGKRELDLSGCLPKDLACITAYIGAAFRWVFLATEQVAGYECSYSIPGVQREGRRIQCSVS